MALVTGEAGLPVACGTVDAIVAQVPAGFACRSLIPTVDRIDNWRHGAFALWLEPDGIIVESANASRGDRPWVPHPISARERARRAGPEPGRRRGRRRSLRTSEGSVPLFRRRPPHRNPRPHWGERVS